MCVAIDEKSRLLHTRSYTYYSRIVTILINTYMHTLHIKGLDNMNRNKYHILIRSLKTKFYSTGYNTKIYL